MTRLDIPGGPQRTQLPLWKSIETHANDGTRTRRMKRELWEEEKWLFRLFVEMVCITSSWNMVSEFSFSDLE
jgi:hypothetical protein